MSLQDRLFDLDDLHSFSDLSTFTQNIPIEWVESALSLADKATIRRRRLPADQVLWLVLGMALFRNEPVAEVARRLNICAKGLASDQLLAPSGVSKARQRLGCAPIEWLFRQTGATWGRERYPGDDWHGLQVLAVDGAVLRTEHLVREALTPLVPPWSSADQPVAGASACDVTSSRRRGDGWR